MNAAEAAKKKREKEEENEQRKRSAGKKSGRPMEQRASAEHPVFKSEARGNTDFSIDTAQAWNPRWKMSGDDPFVITGVPSVAAETKKLETVLQDFSRAFNESSLKAGASAALEQLEH